MPVTIKGALFENHETGATRDFLQKIGMEYIAKFNATFYIELNQIPDVLSRIRDEIIDDPEKSLSEFMICSVTEHGVTIYTVGPNTNQEGMLFIPANNVLAIHGCGQAYFDKECFPEQSAAGD